MAERKRKYIVPGLDDLRAELGITANKLAGASGCSLPTTQSALRGVPLSRNVLERIINALRGTFHHPNADLSMIVEMHLPAAEPGPLHTVAP